jgi:hypothetical protein
VVTFLKQVEANAKVTATEDQASSHPVSSKPERTEFNLDIQESEPTADQLKSILEYVGTSGAGTVVSGARNANDAMRKVKEDASLFQRPLVGCFGLDNEVIGC